MILDQISLLRTDPHLQQSRWFGISLLRGNSLAEVDFSLLHVLSMAFYIFQNWKNVVALVNLPWIYEFVKVCIPQGVIIWLCVFSGSFYLMPLALPRHRSCSAVSHELLVAGTWSSFKWEMVLELLDNHHAMLRAIDRWMRDCSGVFCMIIKLFRFHYSA